MEILSLIFWGVITFILLFITVSIVSCMVFFGLLYTFAFILSIYTKNSLDGDEV